jgi:pimeloyl-ACP methyl ester carboxylesterase
MNPHTRLIDIGIKLHIREWAGDGTPFVLLHGLASNSLTWGLVAERLAAAGHHVVAVDQRGHGLSEKTDDGYDFDTISHDLFRLVERLGIDRPIICGQSWGGNVVLAFGARHPGVARGLGFVDGGFLHLQANPANTWESVSVRLRPPDLIGTPRTTLKEWMVQAHPDWDEQGIEATLGNFDTQPDGTLRPWLTLDRHMRILRAMWEQDTPVLYPQVREPVLMCVAERKSDEDTAYIRDLVARAEAGLARSETRWFANTDHDIHVHRPAALVELFLSSLARGVWSS